MRRSCSSTILIVLALIFALTFASVGVGALLGGGGFGAGGVTLGQRTTSRADAASLERLVSLSPAEASLVNFHSVALGFRVDYPVGWRKKENTLTVIFSPTPEGLEQEQFIGGPSVRIGIPSDGRSDPVAVVENVIADFPANTQVLHRSTLNMAGQSWVATQVRFENETGELPGMATVAATNKNEVGYFLVATAPADAWDAIQPALREIMNSLEFVAEAVIPPTPTGPPPPTPTATPTPIIYVVQSGDTLSHIAVKFNVSIEALATRNGIDRPEILRTGQKLVIPIRRNRR